MGKRFTDTEKFRDKWYRRLSPQFKCAWEFLISECDAAGFWEFDSEYGNYVIGEAIDWDGFLAASDGRIEKSSDRHWRVVGFIPYQYGKLSLACAPHKPVFTALAKHGIDPTPYTEGKSVKRHVSEATKKIVLERDGLRCFWCEITLLRVDVQFDHVNSFASSGSDKPNNIVVACPVCNKAKWDKPLPEWLESLPKGLLDRVSRKLKKLQEEDKDRDKEKDTDKTGEGVGGGSEQQPPTEAQWLSFCARAGMPADVARDIFYHFEATEKGPNGEWKQSSGKLVTNYAYFAQSKTSDWRAGKLQRGQNGKINQSNPAGSSRNAGTYNQGDGSEYGAHIRKRNQRQAGTVPDAQ